MADLKQVTDEVESGLSAMEHEADKMNGSNTNVFYFLKTQFRIAMLEAAKVGPVLRDAREEYKRRAKAATEKFLLYDIA